MAHLKVFGLLISIFLVQGKFIFPQGKIQFPENARVGSRIIDGYPAEPGQFPYQVHIHVEGPQGNNYCGGTLISNKHVLTSAHCLDGYVKADVLIGTIYLSTGRKIVADEFVIYPEYESINLHNDIGIIVLPSEIDSETAKPIRLPKMSDIDEKYEGVSATISGWGILADGDDYVPDVLQYVALNVISNEKCATYYGDVVIDSTLCCQGIDMSSQSICLGDSGGPLTVQEDDDEVTLIGIASFISSDGCSSGNPSGYVRTNNFLAWINQITGIEIRP